MYRVVIECPSRELDSPLGVKIALSGSGRLRIFMPSNQGDRKFSLVRALTVSPRPILAPFLGDRDVGPRCPRRGCPGRRSCGRREGVVVGKGTDQRQVHLDAGVRQPDDVTPVSLAADRLARNCAIRTLSMSGPPSMSRMSRISLGTPRSIKSSSPVLRNFDQSPLLLWGRKPTKVRKVPRHLPRGTGGLSNASCSAAARMRARGIGDRLFRNRVWGRSVYVQCETVIRYDESRPTHHRDRDVRLGTIRGLRTLVGFHIV